jgi:putrescine transport system ATP-binding protein
MEKGRLAQIGPPTEVYEQPATRSVADFVGDINLFTVTVGAPREGGKMALIGVDGLGPFLVEPPSTPVEAGQSVTLGLRPEKIALTRPGQTPPFANQMAGVVFDIGYLGDWTVFLVKLAEGQVVRVTRANAERRVADPLSWDDAVTLSFPPDAAVVLTR